METTLYHSIFVQPWPWWVSGPLIGLYMLALLFWARKPLGASAGFTGLLEAARRPGAHKAEVLDLTGEEDPLALPHDPREKAPLWRVWMLGGFALGGFSGLLGGGASTGTFTLPGMGQFLGLGTGAQALLLFAGGILIGFGTRMSGGCTSGHAITGISARQLPSVWATCLFFATGMAVSFLMAFLAGGAS